MYFETILGKIFSKINEQTDVKLREKNFQLLESKLFENQSLKHQFELLSSIKEAKKLVKTKFQLENFLKKIRNKNFKFITENKITPVTIWNENKKLMEYYNIDPRGIVPSVLDKSIEISTTKNLNETAIKSYIGEVAKRDKSEDKKSINESFKIILENKSQKDLNKQFKIVGFLASEFDNINKNFVYESLRKLRTMQKSNYKECVQKLHKLRILSEKILREYQADPNSKKSAGQRVSLKDLSFIKNIQVEAPKNYLDPEKIFVSFQIPFYPVGAFFNELRLSAIDIKKRLDRLETNFINKYVRQYPEYFNPKGAIWQVLMRVNGIKEGNAVNARVKVYLNAKPGNGNSFEDYYSVVYQMLKEFNSSLSEVFPDELTIKAQKDAIKKKDPTRVRAKRRSVPPSEKQKQSGTRRRKKDNDELEYFNAGDEFGGLF